MNGRPLIIESKLLNAFINKLDDSVCALEEREQGLQKQVKELQKQISDRLHEDAQEVASKTGSILRHIAGSGDLDEIGPVGAIIISKIKKMTTIEEVHTYINSLIKQTA
jgi:TRAP-type mannitol/chloroaromatic compound transport system permease large subunit